MINVAQNGNCDQKILPIKYSQKLYYLISTLDRQQERMKAVIEEQLDKVEEIRIQTEERCRNEYSAILNQSDEHSGQIGRV